MLLTNRYSFFTLRATQKITQEYISTVKPGMLFAKLREAVIKSAFKRDCLVVASCFTQLHTRIPTEWIEIQTLVKI